MTSLKQKKRGRPSRNERIVKVWLRNSTYELWKEKKSTMGYSKVTNSEFAEVLLHSFIEKSIHEDEDGGLNPRKRRSSCSSDVHANNSELPPSPIKRRPQFTSTSKKQIRSEVHKLTTTDETMDVDVTGIEGTVSFRKCRSVNPSFASLAGNPFHKGESKESDTDSSNESSYSSDEDCEPFSRLSIVLNETSDSSETDSCEENSDLDDVILSTEEEDEDESGPNKTILTSILSICNDISADVSLQESGSKKVVYPSMTPSDVSTQSVISDASQIPVVEPTSPGVSTSDARPSRSSGHNSLDDYTTVAGHVQIPVDEPLSMLTSVETDTSTSDIEGKLKQALNDLLKRQSADSFDQMAKQEKVIVTLDKLLALFAGRCNEKNCGLEKKVWHRLQGSVLIVGWNCSAGHGGVWESSDVLTQRERGQKIYVNNVVLAASVILSGNNFSKIALLVKCLNLNFISNTTFCRIQKLHVIPTVQTFWSDMKKVIHDVIKEKMVVLSGDGTSTVKEITALKSLLERLIQTITIEELTTDDSSSVIGMVKKLREKYPVLATLKHSLDVWHKSCKLTKALTQAAKVKNCEDIAEWVEPIRNHFWHVCQSCDEDEKKLKDAWLGVAHHVIGEHEWACGQCSHGPLTPSEQGKSYLAKGSKAAEAVRKIIFDEKWLKSLDHYVTFRHTGDLENFNSMMLKHAPKRNSFEYLVFVARVTLAAIDHNMHIFRPQATTRDGRPKFARKYSKRTKKWHAEPVKMPKDYKYMPSLLSQILNHRHSDRKPVNRAVSRPISHPKSLAPTIEPLNQ